jgi:hypothetical protein
MKLLIIVLTLGRAPTLRDTIEWTKRNCSGSYWISIVCPKQEPQPLSRLYPDLTIVADRERTGTGRTKMWRDSLEKILAEHLGYGNNYGLKIGGISFYNTLLDVALRLGLRFAFSCIGVGRYALYLGIRIEMYLKCQRSLGYFFSVSFFLLYTQFASIATASYHSWALAYICICAVFYILVYGEPEQPDNSNFTSSRGTK